MFPIQITIHNQHQLNAVMVALAFGGEAAAQLKTEAAVQVEKPAKAKTSAPKAAPADGPRTAEAAVADAPVQTAADSAPSAAPAAAEPPASTAAAEPIPYERVQQAITKAAMSNRQHVVDTLAKFGAPKGSALKPEQYADFLAALEG